MTADRTTPDPEALLREAAWLKRLARGLVGPAEAEDVVQEAWLAALARPPREEGALRSWLGRVATNLALRSRWRERRRVAWERAAARAEGLPATDEIVEQLELQRRIVDEVLALDEPYRTSIVLVFFHGLGAAEAAARLGVPSSTVRNRVRRALAMLRERLDRKDDGAPHWRATLAGFIGIQGVAAAGAGAASVAVPATTLASGVLVMAAKGKLIAAAVLVLAAGLIIWSVLPRAVDDSDARGRVLASGSGSQLSMPPPAAAARNDDAPGGAAPIETSRFAEAAPEIAAATPARTGSLVVRLRWESDGSPAREVPFSVYEWERQDPWLHERRARSDASGEAKFDGLEPGNVSAIPIWGGRKNGKIEAGRTLELEVAIPAGPAVEGVVVDTHDRPVARAAILCADIGSTSQAEVVATSAPDGSFRLPSTQADSWVVLGARADGFLPSPFVVVTGTTGATLRARLVLREGGAELCGVVTRADGTPVAGAIVQAGAGDEKQVSRPDGAHMILAPAARTRTADDGSFRFGGVEPGTVSLAVRAARLAPWSGTVELSPGGTRDARVVLVRGTSISGRVLDEAGAPVPGAQVTVGERRAELEVFHARAGKDGSFHFEGVPEGELAVTADGEEKGKASAKLVTALGRDSEWIAKLSTGACIRGRVLDDRGEPLTGTFVEVQSVGTKRPDSKWERLDAEGRFVARNCTHESYVVRVRDPDTGAMTIHEVRDVRPGGDEIVIRVPEDARATAWLCGEIVGPDGLPVPAELSVSRVGIPQASPIVAPDPATGRFRVGPVPPGEYDLAVRAVGLAPRRRGGLRVERGQALDAGTIRLEAGGRLVVALEREGGGAIGELKLSAIAAADGAAGPLSIEGSEARSGPLAPGTHTLRVRGPGLAPRAVPFEVRAGETTRLKVVLREAEKR